MIRTVHLLILVLSAPFEPRGESPPPSVKRLLIYLLVMVQLLVLRGAVSG